MYALYSHNKKYYFFNGVSYEYIENPDSIAMIKDIYKKNNGKDIPEYFWDDKAPWWIRAEQPIVNLQEMANTIASMAKTITALQTQITKLAK